VNTNQCAFACIAIALTLLGCREERSRQTASQDQAKREAITYTKADDKVKLVDLPEGSRLSFGTVLTLPQPVVTATSNKSASEPGKIEVRFIARHIVIIDGHLYQPLVPEDSVYTNLETGEKVSETAITKLKQSNELYASWSPVRSPSMVVPDATYMELAASETLPVYADPSDTFVSLQHGKPDEDDFLGSSFNRLTLYPGADSAAKAADLTVGDLRRVLGENSHVLIPSGRKH